MKFKHITLLVLSAAGFCASCANNPDQALLNRINDAIANKTIETCYDAVKEVRSTIDVDLDTYYFEDENKCLAFDIDAKCFVIMKDDQIVSKPKKYKTNKNTFSYFKFTDAYDAGSIYSQYLTPNTNSIDTLPITTGLDMGSNRNIKNIMYNNTTGTAKKVVIRTFCDYLNINAPLDTVDLYYAATNVYVTKSTEVNICSTSSSAYMQVSNGAVNFKKGCSVDLFEIPEGKSVVTTTEEGSVIYGSINAPEVASYRDLTITYVRTPEDFKNGFGKGEAFFRLANDIRFDDSSSYDGAFLKIENTCCIDLNGKQLSFIREKEKTTYAGTGYHGSIVLDSTISEKEVDCYLLDSVNTIYKRSGIYEYDCGIISRGSATDAANFVINGGQITGTYNTSNEPAIVCIGQNEENQWIAESDRKEYGGSYDPCKSTITMYGGYVHVGHASGSEIGGLKGLTPKGYGATVNMYYGEINSEGYCISGMYGGNDSFGGTNINIIGGRFIGAQGSSLGYNRQDNYDQYRYSTLFFPQGGNVNITGGTFIGDTCLNAKAGNIKISGVTLEAIAPHLNSELNALIDGAENDGSVLSLETNQHYVDEHNSLNIEVDNCTLVSNNDYVARLTGHIVESTFPPVTGHINNCECYYNDWTDNNSGIRKYCSDEAKKADVFAAFDGFTESNNIWTEITNR